MPLADVRLICIHGLAAKPPEEDWLALWRRALTANLAVDDAALARAMDADTDLFRSAYWANAIPDHIEESPAYVKQLSTQVDEVIGVRRRQKERMHIGSAGWIGEKVKRFGLDVVDALSRALTIKDDVIAEHLREVRLYRGDQYVADRIRAPLEEELRRAWTEGRRVCILSHSMGTFVSYDVLWRFSHRSEPHYRAYRDRKVDLLVTMGSPLGDPTLRRFMLVERWLDAPKAKTKAEQRRLFPTNVARWHNYAAHGDVVAHDDNLDDDFFDDLRRIVGGFGSDDLRDYRALFNPYRNPAGKANPHKSYGYLVQPKLAQRMCEFLKA